MVRSAKDYTEAAETEIGILDSIAESDPENNKYVVHLLDSFVHRGVHGKHVCMVFEILSFSLLDLMKKVKFVGLPLHIVRRIMRQVLIALDHVHTKLNMIHTDLKPENIMMVTPTELYVGEIQEEWDGYGQYDGYDYGYYSEDSSYSAENSDTYANYGEGDLYERDPEEHVDDNEYAGGEYADDADGGPYYERESDEYAEDKGYVGGEYVDDAENDEGYAKETKNDGLMDGTEDGIEEYADDTGDANEEYANFADTYADNNGDEAYEYVAGEEGEEGEEDYVTTTSDGNNNDSDYVSSLPDPPEPPERPEYSNQPEPPQRVERALPQIPEEDEEYPEQVYGDENDGYYYEKSHIPYRRKFENRTVNQGNYDFSAFENCEVKVVDFGNACWTTKHFTSIITTRQYRSPEAIMGAHYSTPVDIWSAGCIAFELAVGELLFDPRPGIRFGKNHAHLAQCIETLGAFPKDVAGRGKGRHFFTRQGKLKCVNTYHRLPLETILKERYNFPAPVVAQFGSFLRGMLNLDPRKRATARQCLEHPFLTDPVS
eukprot:TRINITY_DN8003_c0_g1_i1.p1 TRINITY_DN8003_c0_g1~~TRINITY_DN8003_c0_g1_i1.p1  ORF type:complete len:544 (-),score=101.53 TRINITY_DN8003_c0_g1_i1:81-1712(-)